MNLPDRGTGQGPASTASAGHAGGTTLVTVLVVVLLSTVVAAGALFSQQWALQQAGRAVPGEGLYWSVAQYQIAHQRLKQELRAVAAGDAADPETIARRWAVLASRASILSEPSAIKSLLGSVSGFEEASGRIAELHRRMAPLLDQAEPLTQDRAQQVLLALKQADDEALVSQLGNDARQAELASKEHTLASLGARLSWVWAGFGLCWAVLALWLLQAVRSARRFAQAAEERQQAVQAMKQAITSKRSFVSMVSHEIRSPLQSIVTAAESLSQDLALGQSRPQSAAAVRRIRHAVSGLQAQMRDLLTIARSDANAGALALQLETFECSALVHDVCADFEEAAQAKGLRLHVSLPDQPQIVHADPIRIAQVLRNLVQNAVRYTTAGRIDVRLETADQLSEEAVPCMRFTVSDTGPGLSAGAVERLTSSEAAFDPNHEAPIESMRIGLFVIRDVLRQLGGRIQISSSPGQGTTARVEIPVQAVPDSDATGDLVPAEPALSVTSADSLHILAVDDHDEVLGALRLISLQLGHLCDVAGSADRAAPLLAATRYDAVLIDLQMPGKNGQQLAQDIRASGGPNAHALLILVSAPDNAAVGLQPPFDGFLAKPVHSQDLAGLIGSRTRH